MRANAKQLNEVTSPVGSEQVKTVIDKVFPLEDAVNAVLYVDKGRTKGKVIIKIS